MENIPARLKHMDELGIDIQVLYPTIFIEHVANRRPEVEIAICKSSTVGWRISGSRAKVGCAG